MNVLLLIVGIVFVACFFIGYKKGLIKILASLLSTLIVVLVVGLISPHVSQWIRQVTPLESSIQKKTVEMLLGESGAEESILEKELPRDQQISLIEGASVPEVFQQMLLANNNKEVYAMLGVDTFGEYIGAYIAKIVADAIAFLLSFLIVSIVVRILIKVLDIINKLPLLGGMNRLAGGVVGIGIGLLVVWVGFIVVTLLYDTEVGKICFENIESNSILKALYDGNLLMKYIMKF